MSWCIQIHFRRWKKYIVYTYHTRGYDLLPWLVLMPTPPSPAYSHTHTACIMTETEHQQIMEYMMIKHVFILYIYLDHHFTTCIFPFKIVSSPLCGNLLCQHTWDDDASWFTSDIFTINFNHPIVLLVRNANVQLHQMCLLKCVHGTLFNKSLKTWLRSPTHKHIVSVTTAAIARRIHYTKSELPRNRIF